MTLRCSQGSWTSPVWTEQRRIEVHPTQKQGMTLPMVKNQYDTFKFSACTVDYVSLTYCSGCHIIPYVCDITSSSVGKRKGAGYSVQHIITPILGSDRSQNSSHPKSSSSKKNDHDILIMDVKSANKAAHRKQN